MATRSLESSLPRMDGDVVRRQVAEVAQALYGRTDELATALAHAIAREVRLSKATAPVPFELVVDGCVTNIRQVLSAIATDTEFDPTAAADLGTERARDGVPLASVMEAYRVGFRGIWDAAVNEVASRAGVNGDALRILTAKILAAQDVFTAAMAVTYRNEETRRFLGDESEREVLIDSVLHGRLFEQSSVWEAADYLRLCPGSNRRCAAWTSSPRGDGCPTCTSGSST
jgi:hypothetical protein